MALQMSSADFFLALRVVVGITCIVSIFGACMIIFTYVAFKNLRTLARQQLVNLSVADIVVAASHFVGLVALRVEDYAADTFNNESNVSNSSTQGTLCKVQGGFTMYGSIASFLWSLALGFYLLMIIVWRRPNFTRYLLFVYYPVCWGVPLALTLSFALQKPTFLGFVEDADIAWCYIRLVQNSEGKTNQKATLIAQLLGYELWFYIAVVFLVTVYFTMLCYLKCRGLRMLQQGAQARRSTDIKLIFVPLIFVLLRMWSAIIDIPTFYRPSAKHLYGRATHTLVIVAGIGDSAQGLANAILFCLFTKHVRQELVRLVRSCLPCNCQETDNNLQSTQQLSISSSSHMNIISLEATTQIDDSSRANQMMGVATEDVSNSDTAALLNDGLVDSYGTNFDHLR